MASPPDILIIGCGYLGRRIAGLWRDSHRRVAALTRGRSAELAALGLEPIIGDVLDPDSLRHLPPVTTVVHAVALDRFSGRSMRELYVTGLANVLAALPSCERFLYVSSTSVYGQADGSEVDEDSPTEPLEESGRVVLEAERRLRDRLPSAMVLRFAGLYGPNRLLRRQVLLKGEPLVGDADKWLNLIHVADGARAIQTMEKVGLPGETYLVADDRPIQRREFYTHLARLLGAPEARFEPGLSTAVEANRRASNRKLRALGWAPRYPTFVEGLAASV